MGVEIFIALALPLAAQLVEDNRVVTDSTPAGKTLTHECPANAETYPVMGKVSGKINLSDF